MRASLILALAGVAFGACGTDDGATALFALPGTATEFYELPFPNDVYRHDGKLDLSAFPTNSALVDTYRMAAQELDGFGLNAAIYVRFDNPLDPKSLPDPAGSVADNASVYLVNVDARSPQLGEKTPIAVRFRSPGTDTLGTNHIVARPFPGFGLLDGTTYALVVTSRVKSHGGGDVATPDSFRQVLAGTALADEYAPLRAYLADHPDDVVSAAVFTTQHATSVLVPALRKTIFAAAPPVAAGVMRTDMNPTFATFEGTYVAPNFQTGDVPYKNPPSGQIMLGADGGAVVQRMETMRFALTVPPGPVPPGGFPIAIYAHGTGGDYKSFIEDGTGGALAQSGIATISTDQVLHGPRNPNGNDELDFFNFLNPYAMRDNSLQGAADAFSQLRLAVGDGTPATGLSIVDDGRTIKLDRTKVYFFGHSQGGLTGPGFVAYEPSLSGAVLSGTGGILYLGLLHKTEPLDIPSLVQTVLRDDPIDEDNPSLALAQMWLERSDGANYAPLMVRHPVAGAPRNIFQTEGFTDHYTPNPSIEAFATAIGGDIVQLPDEQDVQGLTQLRGRMVEAAPIAKNLDGATAVLAQYNQQAGSDGHFVVFDIAAARHQAAEFLGTLARTGTATVVP